MEWAFEENLEHSQKYIYNIGGGGGGGGGVLDQQHQLFLIIGHFVVNLVGNFFLFFKMLWENNIQ